ncbi:MAG: SsrA-binding protein SmpB [Gammaproteobacteria bacterium]|nr:SsrA-binding protein SmpB [Gammaproteobacteria bacterium]MYD79294.1 SsrA-binding protein SmpB [Gammaproteobacteria bacterium]
MASSTSQVRMIARNRRARFDFTIERLFEAGLVLEGWEVKSIRAGNASIADSYVTMRDGEAFISGLRIQPLLSASSHVVADATRDKKLLLHARELAHIYAGIQTRGRTCVALSLYWSGKNVKCEIGLAVGRKKYDKRAAMRERDLQREKDREARES